VVNSDAIRDPIHWSPDSKSVGVKVRGEWVGINLDSLMLKRFKWRDNRNVATAVGTPNYTPLTKKVRDEWAAAVEEESTLVRTAAGTTVEFIPLGGAEGKGVILVVARADDNSQEIWRTRTKGCKGLMLSPNQRWVTFICRINGAVVMTLP